MTGHSADLTFVEPYPDRLYGLLEGTDRTTTQILVKSVQEVSLDVFAKLEEGDVLFIDSSHVAKVGSDVSFLILRVLPRLAPGVWFTFTISFIRRPIHLAGSRRGELGTKGFSSAHIC